ncbi:MAG: hypothetical protein DRN96_03080 [Thermoproteota archaeon]|nr:MAG: hypothetical protein DRN96_03080 [Candidatus Korarchaeota archaeon]
MRALLRDALGYAVEDLAARRRELARILMWEIGASMLSYMRKLGLDLAPRETAAETAKAYFKAIEGHTFVSKLEAVAEQEDTITVVVKSYSMEMFDAVGEKFTKLLLGVLVAPLSALLREVGYSSFLDWYGVDKAKGEVTLRVRLVPRVRFEAEVGDVEELPEVEAGESYMLRDREKAYSLFSQLVAKGWPGLAATRVHPKRFRKMLQLRRGLVVWLSTRADPREHTVCDPTQLSVTIGDFMERAGRGVVLIDGVEWISTLYGFKEVYRLIQSKRDQAAQTGSIILIPVNTDALEQRETALLSVELKQLD